MLLEYMQLGGPLMWPLLACSVLLGAVLVERALVVGIGHRLLGRRLTVWRASWHRRVLPFFAEVPPSVGLLGTVVGVVQSLGLTGGRLETEALGAGLGVACMTTVFGMSIAIVATLGGYVIDWTARLPARGESAA